MALCARSRAPVRLAARPRLARGRHSRAAVVSAASAAKKKVVGIDLGTTNSCVAGVEGGQPVVIPNTEGSRTTPSVVAWTKTGQKLVGQIAKRQAVVNSSSTFTSVKRFIGRKASEVEEERTQVPYPVVVDAASDNIRLEAPTINKSFAPEEVSAEVLRKLANDAAKYLGAAVEQAVVTVPAYFNDSQRQATKDAGQIAGLEVLRIINEPTAASLAYGMDKVKEENIVVFDLGGGTFDVSVLSVGEGVFEVLATSGDTHLGGDDWDKKIVDWLASTFKADTGIDITTDRPALQRLTEAAIKAKEELSTVTTTNINLPFLTADATGPRHLDATLTRAKLEEITDELLSRCEGPLKRALEDSKLDVGQIDECVLVGGSTRIPSVRDLVTRLTGGKTPNSTVNPDECVALGAAIQAGILSGEVGELVLLDVTPLTLGLETLGGVCTKLIERNSTIPTSKLETFTTAADGQTSVTINVLQGEREFASDNKSLGTFVLDGLPPAPRGVPQVEVTFEIGADGILNVAAKDKATGKERKISITGSSTLSEADVKRMREDAERNAAEDKQRRATVDARNSAESLVYQTEKQLKEFGTPNVPPAEKAKVEEELASLKAALEEQGAPADDLSAKCEALRQATLALGQAAYGQQQQQQDASPADDEPMDAEWSSKSESQS